MKICNTKSVFFFFQTFFLCEDKLGNLAAELISHHEAASVLYKDQSDEIQRQKSWKAKEEDIIKQ